MNAQVGERLSLQVETYSPELCQELLPMLKKNWEESPSYTDDFVLNPDFARYKKLCDLGMILCMTARDDGRLVGYAIWYIVTSLNYAGQSGHGVAAYVEPEYRGHGVSLLRRSEAVLRDKGIRRFYWFARPNTLLHRLTEAMGYKPDELIMEKVLVRGH